MPPSWLRVYDRDDTVSCALASYDAELTLVFDELTHFWKVARRVRHRDPEAALEERYYLEPGWDLAIVLTWKDEHGRTRLPDLGIVEALRRCDTWAANRGCRENRRDRQQAAHRIWLERRQAKRDRLRAATASSRNDLTGAVADDARGLMREIQNSNPTGLTREEWASP